MKRIPCKRLVAFALGAVFTNGASAANASLWWEAPVIQAVVKTGVTGNCDPHYLNKSAQDRFLLVNFNADNLAGPIQLYDLQQLTRLSGTNQSVALASSKPFFCAKGGAVSEQLQLCVLGVGANKSNTSTLLTTHSTWATNHVNAWVSNVTAFTQTLPPDSAADGIDFSSDSQHLFSNCYNSSSRSRIERWSFAKLTAPGKLDMDTCLAMSNAQRIRNVSLYAIGGRDLVYFGEGEASNVCAHAGRIAAIDTTTYPWTEHLVLDDPQTFPPVSGSDLTEIKVSGFGSDQLYLYAASDGGTLAIYKLSADGLTAGEKVKVFTPEETGALLGGSNGKKFRNFEVSNDGRYAFMTCNPLFYQLPEATLNVIAGKTPSP